jgi:hypothetical protein
VTNQGISFSILEPYALPIEAPTELASGLDSLEGKVVGALWNTKPEGDDVLQQILALLKEQHQVKETLFFKKPSAGAPAKKKLLQEIAPHVDAFIVGVGD